MIKVDISNVWGQLSLPDLLSIEKAPFGAFSAIFRAKRAADGIDSCGGVAWADADAIRRAIGA